jgi:colanic acid/amylovoran biosynthesis glycosyltransferase
MSHTKGGVGYVLRKFPVLSETFILTELLALEARGVPLHVFSLDRPNDPRFHDDLPRLKAHVTYVPPLMELRRLARHHQSIWQRRRPDYLRALGRAMADGRVGQFLRAAFIANEARRLGLRHLHAHFANAPAETAQIAAALAGVPFSFTAHATDIYRDNVNGRRLADGLRSARFVVTVSDYNRQHLETIARAGANVVRLYNGIDLSRFSPNGTPPASPFRILSVARLVEKKGLPTLIDACRLLRDRGRPFTCEIVGKGALRPQLDDMIKRYGLAPQITLVGPRTQLEVLRRYHAAHVYVLPCIVGADGNREGLPVSIVEALACGLPVVTTPVTGIPEAVRDGENGLIVPEKDASALADALDRLMSDRDLYQRLRSRARASVTQNFDIQRTAEALHRLLVPAP